MSETATRRTPPATARRHIEHDVLLGALPHPIVVIGEDDRIIYANAAAEVFFSSSQAMMKRLTLNELVAFGSPLLALIGQVRRSGQSVNEYGVEVDLPRSGTHKLVDVHGGLVPESADLVVLMLQLRSMATMIERQLTHRASARSVSGMADVLGARDQESAVRHSRCRAIAGAGPAR